MTVQPPSGAVRSGHALVTFLFAVALGFGLVAIASAVIGIARDGDSLLYGNTLPVPLQLSPDAIAPLPAGLELTHWPDVALQLSDPTTKQMLLRSATDFGPLILFVVGLWLLRSFLGRVMDGDPFGPANVKRLRSIGFLLVIGAPLVVLLNWGLESALFNDLPPAQTTELAGPGFGVPLGLMLGGLGAFILAEVFAYGARLREDVEGTI